MIRKGTVVPGFSVICLLPPKGALDPGSALNPGKSITSIWLPIFSTLNQGSALNPRTLNPGTTVLFSQV